MITISTPWKSSSQVPGDTVAVARITGGDGKVLSIAERDIVIGGEKFIGILKIVPQVSYGISLRSNEYSISTSQLQLSNLEFEPGRRYSDLTATFGTGNDVGFENRQADIRIWKQGVTSFDDCFQLFPNGISRKPKGGRSSLTQDVEDRTELNLRRIFTEVVGDGDAATGFTLPTESRGKTKPIIMGEHRMLINTWLGVGLGARTRDGLDAEFWDSRRINTLIKMIDLGGGEWLTSAHDLFPPDFDEDDSIWQADGAISRFTELKDWSGAFSSDFIITRLGDNFWDYRLPFEISSGDPGEWTNPENIIDRDIDTLTTVTIAAGGAVVQTRTINMNFPSNDIDASIIIEANQILRYDKELDTDFILFGFGDSNANWALQAADAPDKFIAMTTIGATSSITDSLLENGEISFRRTVGTDEATMNAYETYLRIEYPKIEKQPLYYGGRGKPYDSWIDSRTNHADNAAGSGSLIRNPSGSAESILRLGPGLGDSDLDTASFDEASNILSDLKADYAFTKSITGKKYLAEVGRQFRSFLWYQPDGTIKIKVLEDTYNTPDRVIRYRDVLTHTFPETDFDLLRTKVRTEYDWDGSTFQNKTAYSEDADAQEKYSVDGNQTKFELKAPFIHDEPTAIAMRDFYLAQWKNIHNIAVITVDSLHLDLDIGDIIKLEDFPDKANGIDISVIDTKAGQNIYPLWFIYDIRRSNTLTFKAIQLHDLTT